MMHTGGADARQAGAHPLADPYVSGHRGRERVTGWVPRTFRPGPRTIRSSGGSAALRARNGVVADRCLTAKAYYS
jgi:hypothetical protein